MGNHYWPLHSRSCMIKSSAGFSNSLVRYFLRKVTLRAQSWRSDLAHVTSSNLEHLQSRHFEMKECRLEPWTSNPPVQRPSVFWQQERIELIFVWCTKRKKRLRIWYHFSRRNPYLSKRWQYGSVIFLWCFLLGIFLLCFLRLQIHQRSVRSWNISSFLVWSH